MRILYNVILIRSNLVRPFVCLSICHFGFLVFNLQATIFDILQEIGAFWAEDERFRKCFKSHHFSYQFPYHA